MAKSEPSPKKKSPSSYSDLQIFVFIIALCLASALILSIAAYSLKNAQTAAKEFDQSKQMLISGKILNFAGNFLIFKDKCETVFAKFEKDLLIPIENPPAPKASEEEIKKISASRIRPLLTNDKGEVFTLEEKKVTLENYLEENKKIGYAHLPLKLVYAILPNEAEMDKVKAEDIARDLSKSASFVVPVSGFGLWAPIYGYIAIEKDGETVIGTTWYEHAETPGLGANIAEPWWQKQFCGKNIFQQTTSQKTDLKTADMGIIVVKGRVKDVFKNSPRANSAVDGISGATLTGDGVTAAYKNSLTPYRAFFIKVHELSEKNDGKKS